MKPHPTPTCVAATSLSMLLAASPAPAGSPETVIRMDAAGQISLDGEPIAQVIRSGDTTSLDAGPTRVRLHRTESPLPPGSPYPTRVVVDGRLEDGSARVRQEYTLLAPRTPIDIEGLGLTLDGEDPGINAAEHERLRDWLQSTGLPSDTRRFEEIHESETGRALRVWYEIAGRRIDGSVTRGDDTTPAARFDSGFHTGDEGWKIHHARSPFYHRESLERVDTVTDERTDESTELRSYQCGCYGWAIGGDWVTLGDDRLYHAVVEWRHHRVGAGLFVGLQPRDHFPWFGIADREKASRLARRAGAYRLTDARGELFAEIDVTLDPDPPPLELGPQSYAVRVIAPDGAVRPLARIDASSDTVEVRIPSPDGRWRSKMAELDALLAAMPTQVARGDGLRDSYLGRAETLIDWVRLIEDPCEDTLADLVSEIDAMTAVPKVEGLLGPYGERFSIEESDYRPPPPAQRLPADRLPSD